MTHTAFRFFKITCSVFTVCGLVLISWTAYRHSPAIIQFIDNLGWLAPFLFIITYCIATILLLPTMVLTLAGGALFGPLYGTILNLIGATIGAAFSFLITRHLLFDWFSKRKNDKLKKLIAGVEQNGWFFVAILRLFPLIPFNLVNYGMGITGISFRLYLGVTFIFLIPAEIIYTYCGYAGMDALANTGAFYKNGTLVLAGLALLGLGIFKYIKTKKH